MSLVIIALMWLAVGWIVFTRTSVRVEVSPRVSLAPAWVHVKAQVDRHEDNRWLEISVDGEDYSRSSIQQLDGADAPITFWYEFKGIPAGEYTVGAAVTNNLGKVAASAVTTLNVISE